MYHPESLKEFPVMPFIRDTNTQYNYDTIYQKKMTGRDCIKFLKYTKLDEQILLDEKSHDIDFNVIIQIAKTAMHESEKKIQLSFHTWLLKNINNNMYFIPSNPNFSVKSTFECGLFPLSADISSPKENLRVLLNECAQIKTVDDKTLFLPYDSCNFVLNIITQYVHIFVSIIKNVRIIVEENGKIHSKKLNNIAVTMHVLVNSNAHNLSIDMILDHISSEYKIKF
jgi:hypothetical protein